MFRLLLAFLLLLPSISMAQVAQWRGGVGTKELDGTQAANLIGFNTYNHITQPLDNLLFNYCNQYLVYNSSALINVSAGSVVVSNSQGTIRLFLQNTSASVLSTTNLDTGSSFSASTTYYIYAIAATNSSTAATYLISASNTAPSGGVYYFQIGSFTTDANSNIAALINNYGSTSYVGAITSKSANVIYQALTDLWAGCYITANVQNVSYSLYTGSISGSMTTVQSCGNNNQSLNFQCSIGWPIKKGDYYEFGIGSTAGYVCNAVPTSK